MPRILVSNVPPPKQLKQQQPKKTASSSAPYPKLNANAAADKAKSKASALPPLPPKPITPLLPSRTIARSPLIQPPLTPLPVLPPSYVEPIPSPVIDVSLLPPLPSLPSLPPLPLPLALTSNDIPVFPTPLPLNPPPSFTPVLSEPNSPEFTPGQPVVIPRYNRKKDPLKVKPEKKAKAADGGKDAPRLSHSRIAVPEDPDIKPYGCNAPGCAPSDQVMHGVAKNFARHIATWEAEHARLQHNASTQGTSPAGRHPSLFSVGVCFNSSKDLLNHLRDCHSMKQKGEVHVPPSSTDIGVDPPTTPASQDGRMFRCALVGCQRTWKNANGLQYHCLTSVTAEEHDTTTVRTRKISTMKKRKVEDATDDTPTPKQRRKADISIITCPYRELRGCVHQYSDQQSLDEHLLTSHIAEPDVHQRISTSPHVNLQPIVEADEFAPFASNAVQNDVAISDNRNRPFPPMPVISAPVIHQLPVMAIPQSGMFTHGYVFARGQAFRPHNRPIDALYFLNVLCSVGNNKTPQQRLSDRHIVNGMLNASFISHLESIAGASPELDLFNPYSLEDLDSAILKISDVLQRTGFGDPLSGMVEG